MLDILPVLAGLLAALAITGAIARRVSIPEPIVLALLGLGLAFVPGLPRRPLAVISAMSRRAPPQ